MITIKPLLNQQSLILRSIKKELNKRVEDDEKPVILDLESVRILKPGKFEIDVVSLMNRKPVVFKVSEGKYLIDIEGM